MGPDYLVYKYRNSIKIQAGFLGPSGTFFPIGSNSWKSKVPEEYMIKGCGNKVLVKNVEDIPKAIKLIWGKDCAPNRKEYGQLYMRHYGDSNQICPYCGGNWNWTSKRRNEYFKRGSVTIYCSHCENAFVYKKEDKTCMK